MSTKHTPEWFRAQIAEADMRGINWLAAGNEAAERGNKKKADHYYDKGQYWLDRSNTLLERAEQVVQHPRLMGVK